MSDAAEALPPSDAGYVRPGSSTRAPVITVEGDSRTRRRDRLATEEPMEIRADLPDGSQQPVAVTMRTPGHDFELAAGFLFSEGLIAAGDVRGIRYCAVPREQQQYNVVSVAVAQPLPELGAQRNFYASSSCGICGKATLDAIDVRCAPVAEGPVVEPAVLAGLPDALRRAQEVFDRTGGLHAAALFDQGGRRSPCARTSAATTPSTR